MPDVKRQLTRVGNRVAVWLHEVLDGRASSGRRAVHVMVITTSGRRTGVLRSTCVRYLDTQEGFVVWGTGSGSRGTRTGFGTFATPTWPSCGSVPNGSRSSLANWSARNETRCGTTS